MVPLLLLLHSTGPPYVYISQNPLRLLHSSQIEHISLVHFDSSSPENSPSLVLQASPQHLPMKYLHGTMDVVQDRKHQLDIWVWEQTCVYTSCVSAAWLVLDQYVSSQA